MIARKLAPFAAAVAAAAVLTIAGTTIAAASGSGPGQRATPDASAGSLCQTVWAVVNSDGTLSRAGCPGTTSDTFGTGFVVAFPRNVSDCAFLATTGLAGAGQQPPAGTVSVTGGTSNPKAVFVQTYDPTTENRTQVGFHLSVDCAPLTRSGTVRVAAPHGSVTITVPHGLSKLSVVLATAQDNVGVSVVSAVPDRSHGKVTIHLSRVPSHGKPVIVGWSVVN